MKVLFVDCCMRDAKTSRTKKLCEGFLAELKKEHPDYEIERIVLREEKELLPMSWERVELRYKVAEACDWNHPLLRYAKQFAEADRIILGAPYWDLAFPALLKVYIENIFVGGITFRGTEQGLAGMSRAEKALYILSAGGYVGEKDPGTEYLGYVMRTLGIPEFRSVAAAGIDIEGADVDEIMAQAAKKLKDIAPEW